MHFEKKNVNAKRLWDVSVVDAVSSLIFSIPASSYCSSRELSYYSLWFDSAWVLLINVNACWYNVALYDCNHKSSHCAIWPDNSSNNTLAAFILWCIYTRFKWCISLAIEFAGVIIATRFFADISISRLNVYILWYRVEWEKRSEIHYVIVWIKYDNNIDWRFESPPDGWGGVVWCGAWMR